MGGDRGERLAIAASGDSTSQVCFFSLPCSLLTPFQLLLYPARLTTSSSSLPPLDFVLGCSLFSTLQVSSSRKPFPLSYTAFLYPSLPSFLLRCFHLVRSISGLKTINLLPLPLPPFLARAIFSISPLTFVLPNAANPLLLAPPRWERMG